MAQRSMLSFLGKKVSRATENPGTHKKVEEGKQSTQFSSQKKEKQPGSKWFEEPAVQTKNSEILHVYKKRPRTQAEPITAVQNGAETAVQNGAKTAVQNGAETAVQNGADTAVQNGAETAVQKDGVDGEKDRVRKRKRLLQAVGGEDCAGPKHSEAWLEAAARFDWLDPAKIRDKQGHRPNHPDYNPRSVKVPDAVMGRLSGTQKEYWKVKQDYMDVVLFFKVGSFYELYEIDAEIGITEFGWKLTLSGVGKCRQVGVPASGVDEACRKLVARGYKVGRVEQIETGAEAKAKRGPSAMVQRKLLRVESPALLVDEIRQPEAVHLLALKETTRDEERSDAESAEHVVFGFAFVDAAAGRFYVGEVRDDSSRSALGALLAQIAPQEIIHERHGLSPDTKKVLRRAPTSGTLPLQLTPLDSGSDFLEPTAASAEISAKGYFKSTSSRKSGEGQAGPLPDRLDVPSDAEALLSGKGPSVSALWALVCHLRRLKVAHEMLPRGELCSYAVYQGSLRLDGQTLHNLELLQNTADGGKRGTLLGHLDSCVTAQGKRLLRRWICHPLRSTAQIAARQDAVEELIAKPELARALREELRKLPDLERLLGRVKAMASAPVAISYFAAQVHQKQVTTFCATLRGLQQACKTLEVLYRTPDSACLILKPFVAPEETQLMRETVEELSALFDYPKSGAKDGGPKLNVQRLEKSDKAVSETTSGKRPSKKGKKKDEEEDPLSKQVKLFAQLVEAFADRKLATWGSFIGEALARLDVLISFAAAAVAADGPTCRPIFVEKMSAGFGVSELTSAQGEASTSDVSREGLTAGFREVLSGAVLQLEGLWHPFAVGGGGGAFVPNDLKLGGLGGVSEGLGGVSEPRGMLLTGPNMGGKSTLLRATCLAVIMAQLGCRVPASCCQLSLVDTIFTRLGASDRIFSGESTFLVECSEAASVLRHATPDSLVILDELGRGTSTFDGYSIAYAVLKHLSETVDCRLLFATHYHPLTAEFGANPRIKLAHMACKLLLQETPNAKAAPKEILTNEEDNLHEEAESDDLQREGQLVFLYKLRPGACPKSYGLQVATLAGIPREIVRAAASAAQVMEGKLERAFRGASGQSFEMPARSLMDEEKRDSEGLETGQESSIAGLKESPERALVLACELFGSKRRRTSNGGEESDASGRVLGHEDVLRLWQELRA